MQNHTMLCSDQNELYSAIMPAPTDWEAETHFALSSTIEEAKNPAWDMVSACTSQSRVSLG